MAEITPSTDTGFTGLLLLARLKGCALEISALTARLSGVSRPIAPSALLAAARDLGLPARRLRCQADRLTAAPLPALASMRDGSYLLLADWQEGRALVQTPGEAPRVLESAGFLAQWRGELLLLMPVADSVNADPASALSWFWPALRSCRRALTLAFIASFFLQGLGLLAPLFFQVVIDKVLAHRQHTTLDVLCAGLLLVYVFEAAIGGLRNGLLTQTAGQLDLTLAARLARHLFRLPLAWFEARRTGDIVAAVRELEQVRAFFTGAGLTVAIDLLFALGGLALLLAYHVPLTALVAGAALAQAALVALSAAGLRALLEHRYDRQADVHAALVETLSGMATLKAAACEAAEVRRWDAFHLRATAAGQRVQRAANLLAQLSNLLQKLATVVVLWLGARLVMAGALTVGELVAFNLIAARVSQPVLRLAQCWQEFQQLRVSLRRLDTVWRAIPEPAPSPAARIASPVLQGHLRFEGVGFRYRPQGPDVIQNLDLDLPAGTVLGVVGASGSGKSTLASLIQRLYQPQQGRILLDDVDLAQLDPSRLRRQIGVVPQEARIFNRSVAANIALAEPDLPRAQIIAAARLAGAHEFIAALPAGYDTHLGEHGATLSGGQRQRLALARALVLAPRLLVLDEATSALDAVIEAEFTDRLLQLARGRTVIIIAHRLSAVSRADRILVMAGGRPIEQGTHAELHGRGGLYAQLWSLQTGGGGRAVA